MSKYFFLFYFVISFGFITNKLQGGEGYLWHRNRNEKCIETLHSFSNWKIYALTAEFTYGKNPVFLKNISGSIPVIRLDTKIWQNKDFCEKLVAYIKTLPSGEIQLDCDVPESKLAKYSTFLSVLRQKLPSHVFSVTILPCHLKYSELKSVAVNVQYLVLQLHGLHKPKNLPETYEIFNILEAEKSIALVRKFNIPFKIALPTYAYLLHYRSNGEFRRLSSEIIPTAIKGELRKLVVPCWEDVIKFRKQNRDISVIWFRLPCKSDRFALEADNLKRLEANKLPKVQTEIIQRKHGDVTRLFWVNHGQLGNQFFTQKLSGYGEVFLYNSIVPIDKQIISGIVPQQIYGKLPPPGTKILVGEIIKWNP